MRGSRSQGDAKLKGERSLLMQCVSVSCNAKGKPFKLLTRANARRALRLLALHVFAFSWIYLLHTATTAFSLN